KQEEGASFIGKDRSYGWQLSLQGKDSNYANDATKEVVERIPKNKEEKSRLSKTNSEPDFGKELSCSLAEGSKSNIVAKGKVFVELGLETNLHNVLLGPNNAHISVDKILEGKDHVALPIPVCDELVILKYALGSQVPWGKHLVLKGNKLKTKKVNSLIPAKNSKKENVEVTSRAPVRNHTLDLGKGRSCSLAVDFKSNVVAKAIGKILEGKDQALLLVPVGDKLKFVEDALGSHVAWSRELVVKAN
ncbi:hypothetical protein IFM89_022289, partial [Coptis chinensis]